MLRIVMLALVLAVLALGAGRAPGADLSAALQRSDAAWARRAEGHRGARARTGPIREAIAAARAGLVSDPLSIAARWRLLRALHFEGTYVVGDAAARRRVFDRVLPLARRSVAVLGQRLGRSGGLASFLEPPQGVAEPAASSRAMRAALRRAGLEAGDAARLYVWAAEVSASWMGTHAQMDSLRAGVAKQLYQDARVVCALQPHLEAGASFRLLARLHARLPKQPLLSPWVDRDLAVPYAERARAIAPQDPANRLALGVTLLILAPARRAEAVSLLRGVASLHPDPKRVVEELAMKNAAREALEMETPSLPHGHSVPKAAPTPGRKARLPIH